LLTFFERICKFLTKCGICDIPFLLCIYFFDIFFQLLLKYIYKRRLFPLHTCVFIYVIDTWRSIWQQRLSLQSFAFFNTKNTKMCTVHANFVLQSSFIDVSYIMVMQSLNKNTPTLVWYISSLIWRISDKLRRLTYISHTWKYFRVYLVVVTNVEAGTLSSLRSCIVILFYSIINKQF
jgi:hypothetical protein